MPAYDSFLALHAAAGAVALATFWINGLLRKGGDRHRLVGRVYLLAILATIVSGVPLLVQRLLDDRPVEATFLGYVLLLTCTAAWQLWASVRHRQAPGRYLGGPYVLLAVANLLAGAGVLWMGLAVGVPLFIGFSAVGLSAGYGMLRKRRRLATQPLWWRTEHYNSVLGAGIATHIAFLATGLPRLLPDVDALALNYVAWFGPLLVALLAKLWLDRRYRVTASPAMPRVQPAAAPQGARSREPAAPVPPATAR